MEADPVIWTARLRTGRVVTFRASVSRAFRAGALIASVAVGGFGGGDRFGGGGGFGGGGDRFGGGGGFGGGGFGRFGGGGGGFRGRR